MRILVRPFQSFFRLEAASGILLLIAAVVALVWANTPWGHTYAEIWHTPITVDLSVIKISKDLLHWINDGLMAIFFFVVGLEIKREVLVGELSDRRKATLAVAGALGGMAVPAVIYWFINAGGVGASGWGIPMATDIAFTLGVLALLGSRIPLPLKVFVTAIAIVDDLGAVLVIAFFYTDTVSLAALEWAGGIMLVLLVLNLMGVRATAWYTLLGVALWVAVLKSGVHATIAGVLLAMTIPARRYIDAPDFLERARDLVDEFAEDVQPGQREPTEDQRDAAHAMVVTARNLETPLAGFEHALHPYVAYLIVPLFAFANAGVRIEGTFEQIVGSPIMLGVVGGLVLGKQVGILAACWLAVKSGIATLPAMVNWKLIWGVALLCGIGFTMSLFIGSLAFKSEGLLDRAKVGILAGSLISGVAGSVVLLLMPAAKQSSAADER